MAHRIHSPVCLAFVAAMLFCNVCSAGLDEGLTALAQGDYATAMKELRPLAERGNAEAQYRIARMYSTGKGYPQDQAQAVAWLRKSAAQNNTSAQQELGYLYTTGDGVPKDDAQAVAWFEKAATLGNPTAQYNLGLMIAKGTGAKKDIALAVDWMRKAAAQGLTIAQFKVGVAYENGEGVAKDPVLAYAIYAIAARSGDKDATEYRDDMYKQLSSAQRQQGLALANAWKVGQPMPTGVANANAGAGVPTAATAASGPLPKDRCSATGQMNGQKFSATNCAVSLFGDQHSVAIWFNEDAITPQEVESFQVSSYADGAKGGRQRTLLTIMFCPGGGTATASPTAVKALDFSTNHAKSPLAGVQWIVDAGKDFKVEKMTGEIKPGALLSGRIVGSRGSTSWSLDFDVTLPTRDAAAGRSCGK